jgi:hypothetical protein
MNPVVETLSLSSLISILSIIGLVVFLGHTDLLDSKALPRLPLPTCLPIEERIGEICLHADRSMLQCMGTWYRTLHRARHMYLHIFVSGRPTPLPFCWRQYIGLQTQEGIRRLIYLLTCENLLNLSRSDLLGGRKLSPDRGLINLQITTRKVE